MAARVWLGTGADPTALNAADNGLSGYVNDDEVFFPPNAPQGPSSSMAAFTAADADLIEVMRNVTYSIGGSGNHLDTSADKVSVRSSSGTLWYKDGAGTTDWAVLNSTSSTPLSHNCFSYTGATLTHLDVLRGQGTIESGGTLTGFSVDGDEAKLVIDAGATVTNGYLVRGVVQAAAAVTTCRISGGTWTQTAGVPTTIEQHAGRSIWKKSGTITTVYAFANSILDFTQADGVTTITTLYKHPSAQVLGWNPENNGIVVVTNLRVLSNEG